MIKRTLYNRIIEHLQPGKAVLIFGARRTGKTYLIKDILNNYKGNVLKLNGEDYDAQKIMSEISISNYRRMLNGKDLLVIDEAQHISDIGNKIKLIVDEIPNVKVLASGSSSFDLRNKTGEPLVGRSKKYLLYPLSQQEISVAEDYLETRQNIESRILFGFYPEIVTIENDSQREEYLREMVNDYLLKDILAIDGLRNASKMRDLLRLIAFQIGSEVSYDELGKQLGMSKNTVESYLDLLSKVYVLYKLGGYSNNLRKEVRKSSKWYFYDTGIRNAVIGDFSPLAIRKDVGELWENFLITERKKLCTNNGIYADYYFWRTYNGQEIDLIEDHNSHISAFEFKWGNKEAKVPTSFAQLYPEAPFSVVNRNNYIDFVIS